MSKLLLWARDNLAVALGMVAVSAITAGAYQAGETNAVAYKLMAEQWPAVSAPVKAQIAAAMHDGEVTRWEYTKLLRSIMDDRRALAWDMNTGTVEEERDKLRKEIGYGHR